MSSKVESPCTRLPSPVTHNNQQPMTTTTPVSCSPHTFTYHECDKPQAASQTRSGSTTWTPFRTLPHLQTWASNRSRYTHVAVSFVDICLRSIGQCCFQNSPLSGLMFVIALCASASGLGMAGLALLGCVSANTFAIFMGLPRPSVAAGLFGYNATLVGCALHVFIVGDTPWSWVAHGYVLLAVPCLSVLSVLVASAAMSVLPPGTPGLTLSFQLTTWMWLLATHNWSVHVSAPFAPSPHLYLVHNSPPNPSYDAAKVSVAVASGIAQCCLASEWYAGILILVGIGLCSPISAASAVLGSTVGTLLAVSVGAPPEQIYLGLYGFNGVLCATALGGVFVLARGGRALLIVVVGVVCSTLAMSATMGMFAPVGLPALSWPFTLVTWLVLWSAKSMKGLVLVDLAELQRTPEDHLEHYDRRQPALLADSDNVEVV
ncbi:hypothetical protein H257_16467 [Aphanomyces astaci]|uniref:Urea transporter n=1 Tax=Aphanomyces astaci TaxID=112090 RepID=W4FKI7_APHAT|nr:hypothetical protein H257_16467 [Aphanomyces astaci]ETV67386.1 hypothetical protein H257_16467 [Aphanomyces astaci]|eukprot:XP_009843201.1 hypothetical protein H257_16467 [Aphanomyces astaci]